jgi:pimeloyl-ACP methyl ester carboxylesterase
VTSTSGYLDGALVTAHVPAAASGLGAVVVPPYGWDDAASYRARRALAERLADAGHLTLRLDLPGTGDSAGDLGGTGVLAGWQRAVDRAVAALRDAGCSDVVAVGLGAGGLLASRSQVDAVVLWGTPAKGSKHVRELTAFAQMEQGSEQPAEGLWVYGGLLPPSLLADLSSLDLTADPVPDSLRRALVLGRDGVGPDVALVGWLSAGGVAVETDAGRGWGELMVEPHRARMPVAALERIVSWVGAPAGSAGLKPLPLETSLVVAGGMEQSVQLDIDKGRALSGVLAVPDVPSPVTVVLLNAGALRRTGPHRAWVDCARRWLLDGVTSLRVDMEGIGDSDGSEPGEEDLYGSEYVAQVRALLDGLPALGVPSRVVLMGLCGGAYWSFQVTQADLRVVHALLVNPKALEWHPTRAPVEASRELRKVLLPSRWRKLVSGELSWAGVRDPARAGLRRLRRLPWEARARWQQARARRRGEDAVVAGFDRLAAQGTGATLVFTAQETLRAELERTGVLAGLARHPGVDLHLLDGDVETHTLAPARVRNDVDAILDAAIHKLL